MRAHIISDLVISAINVLETISIIVLSLNQNENFNILIYYQIEFLISKGSYPNYKDYNHCTHLHCACISGILSY